MTFGNLQFPASDHPFLRQTTDTEIHSDFKDNHPEFSTDSSQNSAELQAIFDQVERWDHFIVLALNADAPASGPPSEHLDQLVMGMLESATNAHGGISCRCQERLYCCAIPHIGITAATDFAEEFQSQLASHQPETISIGIAPYPLLAYSKRNSWDNACKSLDHAAFLGPGSTVALDVVSLNISADRRYQAGNMDSAIAEYSAALELDPNNTNVRNSLGVCFAELKDVSSAAAEFKIVTEIDPKDPIAWYNLGMLERLNGRTEASLPLFKKAHAGQSDFYEIPYQIGKILSEQCYWDTALAYAKQAVALKPEHWSPHSLMGMCLAALDRIAEAIQSYTRSIKINPNNADALSALGWLYNTTGENPEICRTFLEQSIALEPENGLFHHRLGCWHQKHKHFDQAMTAYRHADAWGYDSTQQMESLKNSRHEETHQTTCGA